MWYHTDTTEKRLAEIITTHPDLITAGVSIDTITRWIKVGIVAGDGRVKLSGRKIGGWWYTSCAAVTRFLERTAVTNSPRSRERAEQK